MDPGPGIPGIEDEVADDATGMPAGTAGGVLAGGRLAGRASPQRLNIAFTVLIVAVAGYTLARSLPGFA